VKASTVWGHGDSRRLDSAELVILMKIINYDASIDHVEVANQSGDCGTVKMSVMLQECRTKAPRTKSPRAESPRTKAHIFSRKYIITQRKVYLLIYSVLYHFVVRICDIQIEFKNLKNTLENMPCEEVEQLQAVPTKCLLMQSPVSLRYIVHSQNRLIDGLFLDNGKRKSATRESLADDFKRI